MRYRTECLDGEVYHIFGIPPLLKDRIIKMIKRIFVPILAALFLAGVFGSISGCNTMEGAGKDVEQGGKAIKDEANEHK